jgi:membrane-bound serine protease (ClpP class)
VALVYVELNRPGSILPGALGLIAVLLAIAGLLRIGLNPIAVLLCAGSCVLFLVGLRRTLPLSVAAAATLGLTLGLSSLNPGMHAVVAMPCGIVLGAGTSLLTRIARRARTNKGLD